MDEMAVTVPANPIQIKPGEAGRLIVLLPYTPERVAKIKTVVGHRWHHEEKYWTVPRTDGALAHLLSLLAGEPVGVDPSLRPPSVLDDRKPPHEPETLQGAAPAPRLLDRVREPSVPDITARALSRPTWPGSGGSSSSTGSVTRRRWVSRTSTSS